MILIARMKQMMEGLLRYVQYDYETVPEEETFLYHLFYGTVDGNFDFYQEAKKMFLKDNKSPRKISLALEYPRDKTHFPLIVIREPSRNQVMDAPIGGYGAPVPDIFGSKEYEREGFRQPNFSEVQLMCFSENMLQSVLMCDAIYALLIGARNTLEEEFTKFEFNTSEVIAENALFPTPILLKLVQLKIEEIDRYPSIIRPEYVKRFVIEDAIPVGADPGWEPDPKDYFLFSRPYIWLDEITNNFQNRVLSNTDWELTVNNIEEINNNYSWLKDMRLRVKKSSK